VKTALDGLERHLLMAASAATIAAHLLVARNGLLPVQHPWTFALEFWRWLLLAYVAAAVASYAALWLPLSLVGRPALARALVAAECGAFAAAVVILNPQALMAVVRPDAPAHLLSLASAGAATLALALAAAAPLARPWALRIAAGLAIALAALAFRAAPAPTVAARALPAPPETPALVVFGIDGGDWAYIDPLIARGALPNLARLRAAGASGPLATVQPTLSPAIWTTMATGTTARRHGIRGFTATRIGGITDALPGLHPLRGLLFDEIVDGLRARQYIRERPVGSAIRRVPAFWNIATAYGLPTDVVDWWATAPAEPVLGHVVSDRLFFEELTSRGRQALPAGLAHPPGLAADAARLIVLPDQITLADVRPFADVTPAAFEGMRVQHPSPLTGIAHELTYFIAVFESTRKIALHVVGLSRARPGPNATLFVLFRIVDKTGHTALQFSPLVADHADARAEDIVQFGNVAAAAYAAVDRALGDILAATGPANVVIVSDHGFHLEGEGPERAYNHQQAPPGIFIGSGPSFAHRRVEGLGVYDVFPLLAYLKALPVADNLPGRVPTEILDPAVVARRPVERMPEYAVEMRYAADAGTEAADAEMLERLRALGYLK
jgi:type I phosphodiesterase/nucleotide pyrophosphatase